MFEGSPPPALSSRGGGGSFMQIAARYKPPGRPPPLPLAVFGCCTAQSVVFVTATPVATSAPYGSPMRPLSFSYTYDDMYKQFTTRGKREKRFRRENVVVNRVSNGLLGRGQVGYGPGPTNERGRTEKNVKATRVVNPTRSIGATEPLLSNVKAEVVRRTQWRV